MSIWKDKPRIVKELGELILEGLSESEMALELNRRYAPEIFSRSTIGGKIYRPNTRAEFRRLFTPSQIELINSRFSMDETEEAIPLSDDEEEPEDAPARGGSYLARPVGYLDDGLGPLERPHTCLAIGNDTGNVCGKKIVRGTYCAAHAEAYYQPHGNSSKKPSGRSRPVEY